jgi:hypothetical protein
MPGPGNGRRHRGSAVRFGGEGMARVGVAAVQLLTFVGLTPLVAGPGHAYRGRRRPGTASSSPYDPGSRHFHG